MNRRLILLVLAVALLAGFGSLLHSPPSLIDAVSGATPKSRKAAQEAVELEGSYVFCINPDTDKLLNSSTSGELKKFMTGESDSLPAMNDFPHNLYVSDADAALLKYAKMLCEKLDKAGVEVELRTFSDTMLRSRIVSGKYEMFLASENLIDMNQWDANEYLVLDSSEMR